MAGPTDPLDAAFLRTFRLAAVQAGAVAHHLRGKVVPERKGLMRSPEAAAVTAVDLATQDVILHALRADLPDVGVDAEEKTPLVSAFPPATQGRPLVVVDPVDGTLNYIRGSQDYAVMGALMRDGVFTAAIIHFPEHRTLYWAVRGGGCHGGPVDAPVSPLRIGPTPDLLLASPAVEARWRTALARLGMDVAHSRCSAVDSSAPATGRARAAVSRGRPDRRRALGYLLTAEAGGVVYVGDQRWTGEDPNTLPGPAPWAVVAADEATAARVLGALRGG